MKRDNRDLLIAVAYWASWCWVVADFITGGWSGYEAAFRVVALCAGFTWYIWSLRNVRCRVMPIVVRSAVGLCDATMAFLVAVGVTSIF